MALAMCSLPVACSGGGAGLPGVTGDTGSSLNPSIGRPLCLPESLNGAQFIATVIRAGEAYNGELLAPAGDFESASSPLRAAVIKRRDDAIMMLRGLAGEAAAVAASGGIQSSSGEAVGVNGRTVIEVRSKYGSTGRVVTVVDCVTGLVRKVAWESFG